MFLSILGALFVHDILTTPIRIWKWRCKQHGFEVYEYDKDVAERKRLQHLESTHAKIWTYYGKPYKCPCRKKNCTLNGLPPANYPGWKFEYD